jgi:hypothetical protein
MGDGGAIAMCSIAIAMDGGGNNGRQQRYVNTVGDGNSGGKIAMGAIVMCSIAIAMDSGGGDGQRWKDSKAVGDKDGGGTIQWTMAAAMGNGGEMAMRWEQRWWRNYDEQRGWLHKGWRDSGTIAMVMGDDERWQRNGSGRRNRDVWHCNAMDSGGGNWRWQRDGNAMGDSNGGGTRQRRCNGQWDENAIVMRDITIPLNGGGGDGQWWQDGKGMRTVMVVQLQWALAAVAQRTAGQLRNHDGDGR